MIETCTGKPNDQGGNGFTCSRMRAAYDIEIHISAPHVDRARSCACQPPGGGFQPTPLTLTWSNPNEEYHYVVIEGLDEEADFILPDFIRQRIGRFRFVTEPKRQVDKGDTYVGASR